MNDNSTPDLADSVGRVITFLMAWDRGEVIVPYLPYSRPARLTYSDLDALATYVRDALRAEAAS
jgi:hypothetical protein